MKKLVTSVLATIALAAPSLAAEPAELPIANPGAIVESVSPEQIRQLVTELGAKNAQIGDAENNKVVNFEDANLPFTFGITGCDIRPGKCLSLVMLVFLKTDPGAVTVDMVNKHNEDGFFDTAIKLEGDIVAFGRAVVVDGGVTRRNLAMNVVVYAALVHDGMKRLNSQLVASNPLPGTYARVAHDRGILYPVRASRQQLDKALAVLGQQHRNGAWSRLGR